MNTNTSVNYIKSLKAKLPTMSVEEIQTEIQSITDKRISEIRNTPTEVQIKGTSYYVSNDGAFALDIPAIKVFEEDENTVTYTAVITNIPEKDYTRDVIAVPYICVNGEYTFYEEMTRNYKQVTEAVAEAYEKGEVELTEEQITLVEKVIGRTLTVA